MRILCASLILVAITVAARAQSLDDTSDSNEVSALPEYNVLARHYADDYINNSPFSAEVLGRDYLDSAPQRRLDDVLRSVPGFSLFRRSSSRVAHPTSQGVSLRNIGPNGAGRTLVLRDGIPQNDPFGGWVFWNRLPIAGIERVEVQRGGGAGVWGNAALGGTIQIFSPQVSGNKLFVEAIGGSHGTIDATINVQRSLKMADIFFTAHTFMTDGYPVLREDQRGSIDENAFSETELFEGGVRVRIDSKKTFTLRTSYFEEERGNGTPLTGNGTKGYNANASLSHIDESGEASWLLQFYYQQRDFNSTFSSAIEDRGSERPALDQFDVPADAWGGSFVMNRAMGDQHHLLLGADARRVEGATHEQFFFNGESFNLQRKAGGAQTLIGIFAEDRWTVSENLHLIFGLRGDYWRSYEGLRQRVDLSTSEMIRNDRFEEREEWVGNVRLGMNYNIKENFRLRGLLYTGFRAPTLNELYRPFRVRSDITESNPELDPERLYGGEITVEWRPGDAVDLSITYFRNHLNDAVANVTLAQGPGNIAPCGFVPNGGSCRQRRNLDRVEVEGFEVEAGFDFGDRFHIALSYLYSDARISENQDQPVLKGNRLAQTPAHEFAFSLNWEPVKNWLQVWQVRYTSAQYENDTNTLELGDYIVVDWSSTISLNDNIEIFLGIENLLNENFTTGIASNGLTSISHPRMINGGFRLRY